MNVANMIHLYSIVDNEKIYKYEIPYDIYYKWGSSDDICKIIKRGECRLAYFDEEEEFISVLNSLDFSAFHNILLTKAFAENKVVVIASNSNLDNKKFNTSKNFRYLIQTTNVSNQRLDSSIKENKSSFLEDITSSSSSNIDSSRSKRHRSIKRYSAEIRKELNWLTGSEVTDGETIVKKWRIKNTGTKKWKPHSVKCVLLPSEYSNWVQYGDIKVPACFADQKVDIEMEITIIGRWPEESSYPSRCSRIKLKWLLFMEKLVKETETRFMDYILAQLELEIRVRPVNFDSIYTNDVVPINVKTALSESSIEKVDQDYSIVDMSDEDEQKKSTFEETVEEPKKIVIAEDLPSEIEMDLPECPNVVDDFQITDFHKPGQPISSDMSVYEKRTNSYEKRDSATQVMTQNDVFINLEDSNVEEAIHSSSENIKKNSINGDVEVKAKNNEITCLQLESIHNQGDIDEGIVMVSPDIEAELNEQNKFVQNEDVNTNENSTHVCVKEIDDSVKEQPEITKPTSGQVSISESVVLIVDDNSQDVQDIVNTENEKEIIDSELNPAVIDDLPDVGVNVESENPTISGGVNVLNQDNRTETHQNTDPTPVCAQPTYMAGVLPDVAFQVPTAPGLIEYPHNNYWQNTNTQNFIWPNFNMLSNAPNPAGCNNNPTAYVPPVPQGIPIPFEPIQNTSSNRVIQELAKNGNIPSSMKDTNWFISNTGNHYDTTLKMQQLQAMGFNDTQRNHRLLQKFDNNLEDVIQELID